MRPFQPGNPGKPRGAKNKVAATVLRDFLDVWDQPVKEGSTLTRGKAALLTMARERPHEFAKLGAAFVPKEFTFETIATELDDEELRRMIQAMRQQLNNQEAAALPAPKVIDHVN